MTWEIEYTDEFGLWWEKLSLVEQEAVAHAVGLLEELGPALSRPYADTIKGSKFNNMKELRVQHKSKPYRILYAFDPRRVAILLIGGNKGNDKLWYETFLPSADKLFQNHLEELKREVDNGKIF